MKVILFLAVFLLLSCCKEKTTSTEASTPENEPSIVVTSPIHTSAALPEIRNKNAIQEAYGVIASKLENRSMDSVFFKHDCNGERSGQVTYFSDNGQLRLIRHTYHAYSHFSATDEYFLKNDSLYFLFSKQVTWSFADQNKTKDNITENRTYIIGNKPIQCLQKKYTILAGANDTAKATTPLGATKDVACMSMGSIYADLALFLKLRNQKDKPACLELQPEQAFLPAT